MLAEEVFEDISPDDLLRLMAYVDMAEVNQAATVIDIMGNIVDGSISDETTPFQDIYPEDETTTEVGSSENGNSDDGNNAETEQTTTEAVAQPTTSNKELLQLLEVIEKLSDTSKLKEIVSPEEFDVRMVRTS